MGRWAPLRYSAMVGSLLRFVSRPEKLMGADADASGVSFIVLGAGGLVSKEQAV